MRTSPRTALFHAGLAALMAEAPIAVAPATDAPASTEGAARAIVVRAIRAAGGRDALEQAATLRWSGDAVVYAGDRRLDIRVATVVRPFQSARSETWLREQGPATKRTLVIDGDDGWIERNGRREPLPAAALRHEIQQYALYGLMRLLPLLEDGVALRALPPTADGGVALHVEHPAAPAADLYFDAHARLRAIVDQVIDPNGGPPISQRIELRGTARGAVVRWPRTIRILQDGAPYFELTIRRLTTGR